MRKQTLRWPYFHVHPLPREESGCLVVWQMLWTVLWKDELRSVHRPEIENANKNSRTADDNENFENLQIDITIHMTSFAIANNDK